MLPEAEPIALKLCRCCSAAPIKESIHPIATCDQIPWLLTICSLDRCYRTPSFPMAPSNSAPRLPRMGIEMSGSTDLKLITFAPTSAKDALEKLRREIERIEKPAESRYAGDHVINAFWTAWHLHEWIWDAIREQPDLKIAVLKYRGIDDENIDDQKAFGAALARRFVPLKICRMIATSPKHVQVVLPSGGPIDGAGVFLVADAIGGGLSSAWQDPVALTPSPMVIIMGRQVVATRLLGEIDDYWATLIDQCQIRAPQ